MPQCKDSSTLEYLLRINYFNLLISEKSGKQILISVDAEKHLIKFTSWLKNYSLIGLEE